MLNRHFYLVVILIPFLAAAQQPPTGRVMQGVSRTTIEEDDTYSPRLANPAFRERPMRGPVRGLVLLSSWTLLGGTEEECGNIEAVDPRIPHGKGRTIMRSGFPSLRCRKVSPGWQMKNIENANLLGANLEGADLRGASLGGARLSYANLNRLKLDGAVFAWTHFEDVDLRATRALMKTRAPDVLRDDISSLIAFLCALCALCGERFSYFFGR